MWRLIKLCKCEKQSTTGFCNFTSTIQNIYKQFTDSSIASNPDGLANDLKLLGITSLDIEWGVKKVERWSSENYMDINTKKSGVLHLGHFNPKRLYICTKLEMRRFLQ